MSASSSLFDHWMNPEDEGRTIAKGVVMEAYALDGLLTFSGNSHTKNVFFESDTIKAQMMGLETGQEIPPCRMNYDVLFVILDGRGVVLADGEERVFEKSSFLFVPKECGTRSIRALTKTAILAV